MATEGRSHDRLPLGGHLTTCVSPRPAALRGVILRFWIDILSLSTVQVFMPQTTTTGGFNSLMSSRTSARSLDSTQKASHIFYLDVISAMMCPTGGK